MLDAEKPRIQNFSDRIDEEYGSAQTANQNEYQYLLTTDCAGMLPAPEVDEQGRVSQQWLDGLRLDDFLSHPKAIQATYFAEIMIKTLEQVFSLIEGYGLLLADRINRNIFVMPVSSQEGKIFFTDNQGNWDVKQIDFGEIYDLTGTKVTYRIEDQQRETKKIYDIDGATARLTSFLNNTATFFGEFIEWRKTNLTSNEAILYERLIDQCHQAASESDRFFIKKMDFWEVNPDHIAFFLDELQTNSNQYCQISTKNINWGLSVDEFRSTKALRRIVDSF